MKNLVLSAACGLDPKQIEFFLKSLRKYYNEDIFFLVKKEDIEVKKLLNIHACNFLEIDVHKFDVQIKRYSFYLKILEENEYKNVLICDSRDIYFQSNPFDYNYKGSINFFLEDKKIKECPYNSNWLIKTYGQETFEKLSNKIINCSGTTLGASENIKTYLNLEEIKLEEGQIKLMQIILCITDWLKIAFYIQIQAGLSQLSIT